MSKLKRTGRPVPRGRRAGRPRLAAALGAGLLAGGLAACEGGPRQVRDAPEAPPHTALGMTASFTVE